MVGSENKRRSQRPAWIAVIVIALAIATGSGWAWWTTRNRDLSVKPPRAVSSQPPLPGIPSSVQVTASVPIVAITEAISKSLPPSFQVAGRQKVCAQLTEQIKKSIQKAVGGDVGKVLGEVTKFVTEVVTVDQIREVCQDVDYHVNVIRSGAIQVASAGDHVHIAIPISAEGQAGFTGEVAKALALNKKNFRGALNAFADLRLDLGRDWCPALGVSADFNWTNKAEFEIVHNWWINIDGQVGPKLKGLLEGAMADLRKRITCDDVKKAISPFWHPYSFPIPVPGDAQPVAFVNLTPLKIGFSGVQYQNTALSAALGIEGTTEVTSASANAGATISDLPALERISASGNQINIVVPIRVRYDDAVAAWTKLFKDKTFSTTLSGSETKVTIDDIAVYPSEGRLAIAMHFFAKIGSRVLDTSGWVYLLAEPSLDETNQILRIKNVTFTRQLDSDLWNILSALFSGEIKQLIEDKGTYDLKPVIASLRGKLNDQLAKLKDTQKIAIDLQTDFIGLKQTNVADQALEIGVGLKGTAAITIDSIMALH